MTPDFAELIERRLGLRLLPSQRASLLASVDVWVREAGVATVADYVDLLAGDPTGVGPLWQRVASRLAVRETYFFRDKGVFADLRQVILPQLLRSREANRRLRIWSAGCCTGEEPYSLAMLVHELLGSDRSGWDISIVATDNDAVALDLARAATYREWSFRALPAGLKQRYFTQTRTGQVLDPAIRAMVQFHLMNLMTGPVDTARFDLILCRNVLIYFDPASVAAVARRLASSLCDDGYLIVGPCELTQVPTSGLQTHFLPQSVAYRHARFEALPVEEAPMPRRIAPPAKARPAAAPPEPGPDLAELCRQAQASASAGRHDESRKLCAQAMRRFPTSTEPHFVMAALAEDQGLMAEARKHLRSVLYLDPASVAACIELAALCGRSKDIPNARRWRQQAMLLLQKHPVDVPVAPFGLEPAAILSQLDLLMAP